MKLGKNIETVYLISGNEPDLPKYLETIHDLQETACVCVLYTNKIPDRNKDILMEFSTISRAAYQLIEVPGNAKGRLSRALAKRIESIHKNNPLVEIIFLSRRSTSPKIVELYEQNYFRYEENINTTILDFDNKWMETEKMKMVSNGGEINILIDYENVGTSGLSGYEYLDGEDHVTLFYSQSCLSIERRQIEVLENNTGSFDIVKLKTVGKNGLDFYIAVKVGQMIERDPESKILIITKDSGYSAIRDYCELYSGLRDRVVIQKDIVSGIDSIDGNTGRRRMIDHQIERISIETEFARYEERKHMRNTIIEHFRGTEYAAKIDSILGIIENSASQRERYLSSLRSFGRINGTRIYHMLKDVV